MIRMTSLVLAALTLVQSAWAEPPIFQDLDFPTGVAKSRDTGRILIVDAMTSWCGPCKVMDRTTWVDDDVVAWIRDHAIAIQLDMDVHTAVKRRLAIRAYPTVVVLKADEEFDRVVGLRNGPALLSWLKGIELGETAASQTMRAHTELRDATSALLGQRSAMLEELITYGYYDEAGREAALLWLALADDPNTQSRTWRRHMLPREMRRITSVYPGAKSRFEGLRSFARVRLDAAPADPEVIADWLDLNIAMDDDDATVGWVREAADQAEMHDILRSMEARLFPLLIGRERWNLAGIVLDDPAANVHAMGGQLGYYDADRAPRDKPGVIPAIPMTTRGMAPAKPIKPEGVGDAPKSAPMIPMTRRGMAPAKPTKPEGADDAPKSAPMIPMTRQGMAPAKPKAADAGDEAPKSVPAIPMMRTGAAPPDDGATFDRDDPVALGREIRLRLTGELRVKASEYYGARLAADRDDDAREVAKALLEYADDGWSRLWLVKTALAAEEPRAEHAAWLVEAERQDVDVTEVRAALKATTTR